MVGAASKPRLCYDCHAQAAISAEMLCRPPRIPSPREIVKPLWFVHLYLLQREKKKHTVMAAISAASVPRIPSPREIVEPLLVMHLYLLQGEKKKHTVMSLLRMLCKIDT